MSHKTTSPVTRRQAVGMAGAAGAALLLSRICGPERLLESLGMSDVAQAAATSCVLTPNKTEGPYFVDEKLNRSDIRADPSDGSVQPGTPVSLTMVVVRADGSCAPVSGAIVDIWHANAAGKYSDISSEGTSGKKYLRGLQASDANGQAKFTTIFPGWYQGRAVHIHFKVRVFNGSNQTYEFTSQLFFDPSTASAVYATGVYASRGQATTANTSDGIYGSDGSKLVVALTPDGNGGYAGTFVVGLSGLPSSTGTGTGTGTGTAARHGEHGRRRRRLDPLSPHEDRPADPARDEQADRVGRRQRPAVALRHDARAQDRERPRDWHPRDGPAGPAAHAGREGTADGRLHGRRRPEEDDRADRHGPAQDPRLSPNPPILAANPRRRSRPSADRRLSKGSTLRVRRRSTLDRAGSRDSSTIIDGLRLRRTTMPSIGPMELVIVLVIALLVLGPKRLPDAGRSLGRGLREFKDAITPARERDREEELAERSVEAAAV